MAQKRMKKRIYKLIFYIRKIIIYKILKKETFGVRMFLIANQKVLLIKHQYDNFWVLPGGGVKSGEWPVDAGVRELKEETGIEVKDKNYCKKLGAYMNFDKIKKDTVFVYVCDLGNSMVSRSDKVKTYENSILNKLEVEKQNWFELKDLPIVSKATKRRVAEYVENKEFNDEVRKW